MENIKLAIDGLKYKEYGYPFDFNEFKKDFIEQKTRPNKHKYIAIVVEESDDDYQMHWVLNVGENNVVYYDNGIRKRCYYPLNIIQFTDTIADIIEYYKGKGYAFKFKK